jgi:hypothetical protein
MYAAARMIASAINQSINQSSELAELASSDFLIAPLRRHSRSFRENE